MRKTLRLREPRPVMVGDSYANEKVDEEANDFFEKQAKREGVSVSAWRAKYGIIGAALEARIKDNERAMTGVPQRVLELAEVRTAEDAWYDRVPGGQPVASILDRGVARFRKDMPKRRRGRPFKRVRVQESAG
jgi:hypothetical protein